MQHELFGELTYHRDHEAWEGTANLPVLVALTGRQGEKRSRRDRCPIHIEDPARKGPSREQEAAFKHLVKGEKKIAAVMLEELFASYKEYYADENWRKFCDLPDLDRPEDLAAIANLVEIQLSRKQRNGMAYVIFNVLCDWEGEHGMYVVYHRDREPRWTTYDDLESVLPSEKEEADTEPAGDLLRALLAGKGRTVKTLLADGVDINDYDDPWGSALHLAVRRMDSGLVQRLLVIGADPKRKDDEKKTPLQVARELLRPFTTEQAGERKRKMIETARRLSPASFAEARSKLEEIIRMLATA